MCFIVWGIILFWSEMNVFETPMGDCNWSRSIISNKSNSSCTSY